MLEVKCDRVGVGGQEMGVTQKKKGERYLFWTESQAKISSNLCPSFSFKNLPGALIVKQPSSYSSSGRRCLLPQVALGPESKKLTVRMFPGRSSTSFRKDFVEIETFWNLS